MSSSSTLPSNSCVFLSPLRMNRGHVLLRLLEDLWLTQHNTLEYRADLYGTKLLITTQMYISTNDKSS